MTNPISLSLGAATLLAVDRLAVAHNVARVEVLAMLVDIGLAHAHNVLPPHPGVFYDKAALAAARAVGRDATLVGDGTPDEHYRVDVEAMTAMDDAFHERPLGVVGWSECRCTFVSMSTGPGKGEWQRIVPKE